ncbi:hypothetical protein [Gimesia fumaroli]|uniref:hypothetical protein n=1 Tax=Gimesia fumaroli TaxID=2527976 RepID=UPI0011A3D998|nr:hypothetical protein [Gimesia fumaroli]
MQIHSSFIEYETQLHWTTRCLIRVCLLLSLWNLPFPWLHNHDVNPVVANNSAWLPSHLDQYHTSLVQTQASEQGWHLHFVYLGEDQSNDPLKKRFPAQHYFIIGESSQSLPVCESTQTDIVQQMLEPASLNRATTLSHKELPVPQNQAETGHFLQASQSQSLHNLISVSLC